MCTEIPKNLVDEEAIKQVGYDFEESENLYHVMKYLHNVSIYSLPISIQVGVLIWPNVVGGCSPPYPSYKKNQTASL